MSDFEMLRQLRDLNTPRPPHADLWPTIAARIATTQITQADTDAARQRRPSSLGNLAQPRRRMSAWLPLAAAASLLVALGGTLYVALHQPAQRMASDAAVAPLSQQDAQAFAAAHGSDPRLASAVIVLDSAHAELEQALDQRPDAAFLVGLLARTNARRVKLDHYGMHAG